jgi:hypothetical protein
MSAIINTEIDTVTKVAKVKTPTLSGKYIKFLVFGHWFVDRLAVTRAIDEATTEAVREQLELFAGVAKQTEMFDLFFAELKDSTKSMKALIKRHNTPPKEKKTRVKAGTDGVETEKKRGRKKKVTEVVHDKQDDLVAEIVAATQDAGGAPPRTPPADVESSATTPQEEGGVRDSDAIATAKKKYVRKSEKKVAEPVIEQIAEPVVVVAPVEPLVAEPVKKKVVKKTDAEKLAEKTAKDAEKLAEKTAKDAEKLAEKEKKDAEKLTKKTADKPAKDAKKTADKPAKSKKDKNADKNSDKTADNISAETGGVRGDESPADEDELDVKPITCSISNIQYLLDNDNNVYHFSLHTLIGKLSNNNSVTLF